MSRTTGLDTFLDVIRMTVDANPDHEVAVFHRLTGDGPVADVRFGRAELDRRARALATTLSAATTDPVVILMPPGPDYLVAFLGCVYAGLPAVPVYPPNPSAPGRDVARLRAVLHRCRSATLLTHADLVEPLDALLRADDAAPTSFRLLAAQPSAGAEDSWRPPSVRSSDPLFVQFTSGSTGSPRGVVVTHENILANIAAIIDRFGVGAASSGALWLPPYHDMGLVGGLLTPLVAGISVHLMSPLDFLADPVSWLRLVSRTGASHSGAPNFGYALATRRVSDAQLAELDLSSWSVAFCGSEPVHAATMRAFARRFAPAGFAESAFLPCYGLAENTLIVCGGRPGGGVRADRVATAALGAGRAEPPDADHPGIELVSCGPVVEGVRMVVVDREGGAELPAGHVGEVLVQGPSVATGYLYDEEATEQVFGAAVSGRPGRWLRTGDLGYRTADGELVVVGRIKDVLVIRGRNVYPQDLERTVESAHRAVRPGCVAVVGVITDAGTEEVVVVAEVRRDSLDDAAGAVAAEAAAAVRAAVVGDHGVPVRAVHLIRPGSLPKTSSGKVRRAATREAHLAGTLDTVLCDRTGPHGVPDPVPAGPDDVPGVPEVVASALIARRAGAPVGDTGSLDSLQAVGLVNDIREVFGVDIPVPDVLAGLSPAELSARIGAGVRQPPGGQPVTRSATPPQRDGSPVTARQHALCLLQELDPTTPGLVLGAAFGLPADTDLDAVGRAMIRLVIRHEALRTRLVRRGESWVRVVDPVPDAAGEPYLVRDRLPGRPDEAALTRELSRRCRRVPALEHGPLFRATLLETGGSVHLVVTVHHAVADLWSVGLLVTELAALYAEQVTGVPAELPTPAGTARTDPAPDVPGSTAAAERAWRFWRQTLADELEPLILPAPEPTETGALRGAAAGDGDVPLARTTGRVAIDLGATRTAALAELARSCGTTRYAVLLSALALALARLVGAGRVPIAVPLHGRTGDRVGVVDYLVNTVAVPVDTTAGTVRDLVERAGRLVRGALGAQALGYPELVSRAQADGGPAVPAPEVALVLQQDTPGAPAGAGATLLGAGALRLGGLELRPAAELPAIGPFALATVLAEADGRLVGRVEVDPARCHPAAAERLAALLLAAVDGLVADPAARLADLTPLGADDRRKLARWSTGPAAVRTDGTLSGLVLEAAARHPDRVAVRGPSAGDSMTFGELAGRSATVAANLAASGVRPGDRVGVLLCRRADLVVLLVGVLRAGAAYVPLDHSSPPTRLAAVLTDAGCVAVLASRELTGRLEPDGGPRLLVADDVLSHTSSPPVQPPGWVGSADRPAYLLFTSGSTGRPKGVAISHGSAVNLVTWAGTAFTPQELAVGLAVTPLTFDLSVFELFVPLAHGGSVRVVDNVLDLIGGSSGGSLDGPVEPEPTLLNTVPSAVAALLEQGGLPRGLRVVNMAGEPFRAELVAAIRRRLPDVRVVNLYGPSETTTYSTIAELDDATSDPVPIGRPVGGTRLSVVDRDLRPVPVGTVGELLIGGAGVANGYTGRPDLTAARFLPDPDADRPGDRLYRTGDLVRWRADGQLDFIGRVDHQVKVRGVRVEPGDVEAGLRRATELRDVAVVARGEGRDRRLAAYLVPARPPESVDEWLRATRRRLAQELPAALLPTEYAVLDALPRNAHGKLDRRALADLPAVALSRLDRVAPRSDVERRVAEVWTALLGGVTVGVTDDFLELGGHSLLLARVAHLLGREFGVDVRPALLWPRRTVADQAELVTTLLAGRGSGSTRPAITRLDRTRYTVRTTGAPRTHSTFGEQERVHD